MPKYIAEVDCIFKKRVYIDAADEDEATNKILAGQGLQINLPVFSKVQEVNTIKETKIELTP